MAQERQGEFPFERPPAWWHDAIRQNLEGSLFNKDKFATIPKPLVEEFKYSLVSLTAPDLESDIPEGVYVITDIPEELYDRIDEFIPYATSTLKDPFSAALNAEGNTTPKTVNVGLYPFVIDKTISFYCLPSAHKGEDSVESDNPHAELEDALDTLNAKYFSNLNYVERMRLLFNPAFPDALKKRHLEIEVVDNDSLKRYYLRFGVVSRGALRAISRDKAKQRGYQTLMRKIRDSKTDEEVAKLEKLFESMEPKTHAGWMEYYIRFWERKYGPLY